jgi:hypothetical protein
MRTGPDGVPDANPEAILVGGALDKSAQPAAILGTTLSDITGVVQYQSAAPPTRLLHR